MGVMQAMMRQHRNVPVTVLEAARVVAPTCGVRLAALTVSKVTAPNLSGAGSRTSPALTFSLSSVPRPGSLLVSQQTCAGSPGFCVAYDVTVCLLYMPSPRMWPLKGNVCPA